jgi:hypothetical protein
MAAVVIAALAAANCATTVTVSSHVEHGLDFSLYRTFDWGPADALNSVEDLLDDPDRMARTISEAVTRMLERLPRPLQSGWLASQNRRTQCIRQ